MSILPPNRQDQVIFCENHWPIWDLAPADIGTSAAAVSGLKNATEAARKSFNEAQVARQASKSATQRFYADCAEMRSQAAVIIAAIKAYAEQQADPQTVYDAAQIDPPAPPTPATAPGVPNMISVTLEPSGAITLSWDCQNASASSGGFFNILRKLPGQAGFVPIGGAPGSTAQAGGRRMSFTDFTVPTSAAGAGAQYIIQGRRGTLIGQASEAITVQFGTDGAGGGGAFTINGVSQPMKMAA